MPPDASEPGSPKDWLRHALSDLALARINRPDSVLPEMLCFHAQQAAEKAIKAVLVRATIPAARTHNLGMPLDMLPATVEPPELVKEVAGLSVYAVQARYPAVLEPITMNTWKQ